MARAIIGGMVASVTTSVFAVPALWYLTNAGRIKPVAATEQDA
jgi:hypothetical protein